jgi:hypothetical protein
MSAGTKIVFAAAVMTAAMAVAFTPAHAAVAQYPYCYIDYDGMRSCGFQTLQQCLQVRIGTGMCVNNPYYTGSQTKPRPR